MKSKVYAFSLDFIHQQKASWLSPVILCATIQVLELCIGVAFMPTHTGIVALVCLATLLGPWIFLRFIHVADTEEFVLVIILVAVLMLVYPFVTVIMNWVDIDIQTYLAGTAILNVAMTSIHVYLKNQ